MKLVYYIIIYAYIAIITALLVGAVFVMGMGDTPAMDINTGNYIR